MVSAASSEAVAARNTAQAIRPVRRGYALRALQSRLGNRGVQALVQAKLNVGAVNDPCELEADRIAQQALGTPLAQRSPEGASRVRDAGGGAADPMVARSVMQAHGGGHPVPGRVRERLEQFTGVDLSPVRLHVNAEADSLNDSLNSRAFTVGSDIFVRRSEYRPGTARGDALLGHELAHTVQQGGTPSSARSDGTSATETPTIRRLPQILPVSNSNISWRGWTSEMWRRFTSMIKAMKNLGRANQGQANQGQANQNPTMGNDDLKEIVEMLKNDTKSSALKSVLTEIVRTLNNPQVTVVAGGDGAKRARQRRLWARKRSGRRFNLFDTDLFGKQVSASSPKGGGNFGLIGNQPLNGRAYHGSFASLDYHEDQAAVFVHELTHIVNWEAFGRSGQTPSNIQVMNANGQVSGTDEDLRKYIGRRIDELIPLLPTSGMPPGWTEKAKVKLYDYVGTNTLREYSAVLTHVLVWSEQYGNRKSAFHKLLENLVEETANWRTNNSAVIPAA